MCGGVRARAHVCADACVQMLLSHNRRPIQAHVHINHSNHPKHHFQIANCQCKTQHTKQGKQEPKQTTKSHQEEGKGAKQRPRHELSNPVMAQEGSKGPMGPNHQGLGQLGCQEEGRVPCRQQAQPLPTHSNPKKEPKGQTQVVDHATVSQQKANSSPCPHQPLKPPENIIFQ